MISKRSIKRVAFILVYLILFGAIGGAIYFAFLPDPTCFDMIHNQGEEGVDCGGPCNPCPKPLILDDIEVTKLEWVYFRENKYDLVARIKNPNNFYGAAYFEYQFIVKNENDEEITKSNWEKGFILPKDEKYLFSFGNFLSEQPQKLELVINKDSIKWEKFDDLVRPNFVIVNTVNEYLSGGQIGFFRAKGDLINKNEVDFEIIEVKVLLRDAVGKLLAINKQTMNTVISGEKREFNIIFYPSFEGEVAKIEVEPETNIFSSDNYIRTYGSPSSWKGW